MTLNIVAANKRITELETDNKNLLTKVQEAENTITNLKDMSKDMTEAQAEHNKVITQLKADHEKAVNQLKADYEKQISDLNNKVSAEAKSSSAKALTLVAQAGLPADTLPVTTTEDNSTNILETLKGLSPKELSEKFMNNQKAIFAALKAKNASKKKE